MINTYLLILIISISPKVLKSPHSAVSDIQTLRRNLPKYFFPPPIPTSLHYTAHSPCGLTQAVSGPSFFYSAAEKSPAQTDKTELPSSDGFADKHDQLKKPSAKGKERAWEDSDVPNSMTLIAVDPSGGDKSNGVQSPTTPRTLVSPSVMIKIPPLANWHHYHHHLHFPPSTPKNRLPPLPPYNPSDPQTVPHL
jgi:hypothetical protein